MREQINYKLEIFEGPLDLMLSLISKHKLNIRDIEIAVLVEQFLDYIEQAGEQDIELAGEFLETAAHLILIKTVSLLPKHEAEALKRELEGALIEYALCKLTAEKLRELNIGDLVFVRRPQEIETDHTYTIFHAPSELVEAFGAVTDRKSLKELLMQPPPPIPTEALEISYVSVFSKILYVLKKIRSGERLELKSLFYGQARSEQVATFLAILDLATRNRIKLSEDLEYIEFTGKNKCTT
jgi:segregation and condensation protein A